uniref:Uncharacterized protein n=1 Tax=Aureoumbra lagunensis TaxID=44058 RepID=A0A7S3K094_9STRA|mmetsp:Transcript_10598/g.14656  ORF Transcript_10598/g.14656 Transcript_10598/m.14656 type:complete len:835 (+) Transcript_10598:94-2598(+)
MLMIIREEASKVDEVMETGEQIPPMAGSLSEGSYGQSGETFGALENQGILSQAMGSELLPDFDKVVIAEMIDGDNPTNLIEATALSFLSHTPPHNTPSSYGAPGVAKRGRHLGPANNTLERQNDVHNWGGRHANTSASHKSHEVISNGKIKIRQDDSSQDILSSSFSDMRMADTKCSHDREKPSLDKVSLTEETKRKGALRLESCATLEAAGLISYEQKHMIKDLLILGENEDLHIALDEFAITRDARKIQKIMETACCNTTKQAKNLSGDEAYSSSSSNRKRDKLQRKNLEARLRENSGSPFMELDSQGSLPSSFGASFLSGNRQPNMSGVSIDSDELEGVAAAAAIAASAVGGSIDTETMFLLARSPGTTAASRMGAPLDTSTSPRLNDLKRTAPLGSTRHRSNEWHTSDDVAFHLDLDGVLDDTESIFHQGGALFDEDDDSILLQPNSQPRLLVKINAHTLNEKDNGGGYEDDTSKNTTKKKAATPKASKEKKTKKTPKSKESVTPKTASPAKSTKPKKETTPKRPRKKDAAETPPTKRKTSGTKTKSTKKSTTNDAVKKNTSGEDSMGGIDPSQNDQVSTNKKQEKDKTPRVIPATVNGSVSSTAAIIPPLEELAETPAPVYDALINYPRAKARGARHCVMCGRAPAPDGQEEGTDAQNTVLSTETTLANAPTEPTASALTNPSAPPSINASPSSQAAVSTHVTQPISTNHQSMSTEQNSGAPTSVLANTTQPEHAVQTAPVAVTTDMTDDPLINLPIPDPNAAPVVIPKQNKDVCRECDKATWHHALTGCYFKWCKGCKRFRNLIAFKGKIAASKCDHCRARGREGYVL